METIDNAIILTGMTCCGKSTIANILAEKSRFKKVSFGGYLFGYAKERGIETKKENLQILGQGFIDEDPKLFLDGVIEYSNPGNLVIFEGVRHFSIFDEIKRRSKKITSIFIDVPFDERLRRFNERENDNITSQKFLDLDNHKVESEIPRLKILVDLILDGVSDPNVLAKHILTLL